MDERPKCETRYYKTHRGKERVRSGFDINDSNMFLDLPLRAMTIKTKINKWDLIKLKSFCTAKESIDKMKK